MRKTVKRGSKVTFFIVAFLIVALAYTSFFGIYTTYGDRVDVHIKGAKDIRLGIDIRGGVDATFGPVEGTENVTASQVEAVKEVIAKRLVLQGITDYEAYADTQNNAVIVRFPWASGEVDYDPSAAVEELGRTAQLAFYIGKGTETKKDEDGNEYQVPTGELVLTGDDVASATAVADQENIGQYMVSLKLKDSGKEKFSEATKKQYELGKSNSSADSTISIWLDHDMISYPKVNEQITNGECVISGSFDFESASNLATLINSGALPFNIEVKSYGTVSPTLGDKALNAMVMAGIIAFALVSLFIILYYRLPGVVAVITLLGQMAGSIAAVSGYFGFLNGFTLTLPGIAGIILSVGIGVDANVIMAERIKEEIRMGKTIDGSIDAGSRQSFSAIFDGNITNVIVAVVLMGVFGPPDGLWAKLLYPFLFMFPAATTGAVYSFGYTLLMGIVFNFIMGVGAARLMTRSISRLKIFRKPWMYGGERA